MKIFKSLDLGLQLILFITGVLFCVLTPRNFTYAYCIVGSWQMLSCIVHGFIPTYYPYSGRKIYLWALLVLISLGFVIFSIDSFQSFSTGAIIYFLFGLLIVSPMMAIWYTYICYKEVKLFQQKEWIQLR